MELCIKEESLELVEIINRKFKSDTHIEIVNELYDHIRHHNYKEYLLNVEVISKLLQIIPKSVERLIKRVFLLNEDYIITDENIILSSIDTFLRICTEYNKRTCMSKIIRYTVKRLTNIIEDYESSLTNNKELSFGGIFKGREKEIRITEDKMISVFDFIRVVGGQVNPKKTWYDIEKKYKNELGTFCSQFKFPGRGKTLTPVINVNGMVKLLFWLPGEMAKKFRTTSAETMIRYLGGDLTLIDEIKTINDEHNNNPNNIAQIFREELNSNLLFNQDQINTSKQLVNHFREKNDIFYMFSFKYSEEWYAKFGIVGELRKFYKRVLEHEREFGHICYHTALKCSNIHKVENDFKNTSFYITNKTKIQKKSGGFHTEIIKLSDAITTEIVKEEMIKAAGDRIVDPPKYSDIDTNSDILLELEREKTKQIQEQEKTKQIQEQEKTKQMYIEYEMMRLRLKQLI
jgi:hypothetical protein